MRTGVRLWFVRSVGYSYTIRTSADQEVLAYHWHPDQTAEMRAHHLHLGPASGANLQVRSAHLPTGFISIARIAELLIRDLGVRPRRQDWDEVLAAATESSSN